MDTSKKSPYANGWGLIGGNPELRNKRRKKPHYEHPFLLDPFENPEDLEQIRSFLSEFPIEVEIGFRRGHFLRERTVHCPERRFLGFELTLEWCRKMVRFLEREKVTNTRIIQSDARPLLEQILPVNGVDTFYVFFPDPWWKKRHHKRRLVTAETLDLFHRYLKHDGNFIFRTDVIPYFDHVRELLEQHGGFDIHIPESPELGLPKTHREKKCAELDIDTVSLQAIRKA